MAIATGITIEEFDLPEALAKNHEPVNGELVDVSSNPDVSLIASSKLDSIDPGRRAQLFVPDLAMEIVSENDKFESLMEKAARYRKCRTKEVRVLSADTRQAFAQSEDRQAILNDDQMFESKLIPGFAIRQADLFDRA